MAYRREDRPSRADFEGRDIGIRDNMHDGMIREIPTTDAEYYDMGRIKEYNDGSKGYPREAWNYEY